MILILTDSPSRPLRTIGAYRIATELRRHGCEVEVIDFISRWRFSDLMNYINSFTSVEWVGISTKFLVTNKDIKNYKNIDSQGLLTGLSSKQEKLLLTTLKEKNIPVVVGGPTAEMIIPYVENIDVICLGYADKAVIAVHEHLVNGSNLIYKRPIETKAKVVYCDNDYSEIDLNNIETEYVDNDFIIEGENLPLEISRGCIFKCAFCTYSHTGKKPGTYIRSKESIERDIKHRWEKYKSKNFRFTDDTFNDSIEKMKMIEEIRNNTVDFNFWSYARLDLLAAKPEMIDMIPRIGWSYLTFGIETFNKEAGSSVGKGGNPVKLQNTLIELRQKFPDIFLTANLIVGLPKDTFNSAHDTVQWFIDNPGVVDKVKVTGLGLPNPNLTVNQSLISLDPKKYGYKFIKDISEQPVRVKWKSSTMDWRGARSLAEQLSLKLSNDGNIITHNRLNSNFNFSNKDDKLKEFKSSYIKNMEDEDSPDNIESAKDYIESYISNKLTSRNLKTCLSSTDRTALS